jgi:quercetin dioxygenase-like cupin family protein
MSRLLALLLLFVAAAPLAAAQDAAKVDEKHYQIVYEDERVRVLKVTLGPKERAERHSHPAGSVIHLTSNKATFTLPYSAFGTNDVKSGATNKLEEGAHWPENNSDSTFEALIVEVRKQAEVRADAKPGQVEQVCADRAIPPGWVLTDVETDFVKCGSSFDNVKVIRKAAGLPAGTEFTVCKDSPVPEGWEVTGDSTDFTRCGRNQPIGNLKEIKRRP